MNLSTPLNLAKVSLCLLALLALSCKQNYKVEKQESSLPESDTTILIYVKADYFPENNFRPKLDSIEVGEIAMLTKHNCSRCHGHENGIEPLFMNMEDVLENAPKILAALDNHHACYAYADTSSTPEYLGLSQISPTQLAKLKHWLSLPHHKSEGNISLEVEEENVAPDFSFKPKQYLTLPPSDSNRYVTFLFPFEPNQNLHISSITFIPDDLRHITYARYYVDATAMLENLDYKTDIGTPYLVETDGFNEIFRNYEFDWVDDKTVYAYGGTGKTTYPDSIGKFISSSSTHLLLQVQYDASTEEIKSSPTLNFYKCSEPPSFSVRNIVLDESMVINPPFEVQENSTKEIIIKSPPTLMDIDIVSISPHTHFRCTKLTMYAKQPDNSKIPLLNMPRWDPNQQTSFAFEKPVKVSNGSHVFVHAYLDNTGTSPFNPKLPPEYAGYGWDAKADELLKVLVEWIPNKQATNK